MPERDVGIVVIDSLRSGMPGDENSSEFGEKLALWARLAADLQIPILIVHHADKGRGDQTFSLDRLRGSSAMSECEASVLGQLSRTRVLLGAAPGAPPDHCTAVEECRQGHGVAHLGSGCSTAA